MSIHRSIIPIINPKPQPAFSPRNALVLDVGGLAVRVVTAFGAADHLVFPHGSWMARSCCMVAACLPVDVDWIRLDGWMRCC